MKPTFAYRQICGQNYVAGVSVRKPKCQEEGEDCIRSRGLDDQPSVASSNYADLLEGFLQRRDAFRYGFYRGRLSFKGTHAPNHLRGYSE